MLPLQTLTGVITKNESVSSEIIEIMQALDKHIPTKSDPLVTVYGIERVEVIKSYLFGGDQFTVTRVRSAKQHWQDSATSVELLDGL